MLVLFIYTLAVHAAFQTDPFLMMRTEPPEDGTPLVGNDLYEGYIADLAKMAAKIVEYKYIIRPVLDGKYGSQVNNGSWNGMIGELIRGVSRRNYFRKQQKQDNNSDCLD